MTPDRQTFAEAALPLFDAVADRRPETVATRITDDALLLAGLIDISVETASSLIRRFGGFNHVLAAPDHRLAEAGRLAPKQIDQLKRIEKAGHRMAEIDVLHRDVVTSWEQLLSYCRTRLAHRTVEELHVLFLDKRNRVICTSCLGTGTVDHVPVYPREILRSALEWNASALILVHNHPSGNAMPSEDDKAMTETVRAGAEALGIQLHDHVIIGGRDPYSFRAHGLL